MHGTVLWIVLIVSISIVSQGCGGSDSEGARSDSGAVGSAEDIGSSSEYQVVAIEAGGSVSGRVSYDGTVPTLKPLAVTSDAPQCGSEQPNNRLLVSSDGGVAESLVYLEGVKRGKPIPLPSISERTFNQQGCRYLPGLVAVPLGTWVVFHNDDSVAHNVRVENSDDSLLLNVAQANNVRLDSFRTNAIGPLSVACDYHPWMTGSLVVVENPYYQVTGSDGRFSIDNVPPGTYTLVLWHSGFEPREIRDNTGRLVRYAYGAAYLQRQTVVVKPRERVDIDLKLTH